MGRRAMSRDWRPWSLRTWEERDDLEKVELVFDMLTGGRIPEGVHLGNQPKLSKDEAWSAVWFLQEVARILPDTIDRCDECNNLYEADYSDPGYIDDTDDTLWKQTNFTKDQIKAHAHMHFCSWGCFRRRVCRAG
jgi:hypothetical protein